MALVILLATQGEADLLANLASTIWTQHYTAILGRQQVDYMLRTFQSQESIAKDIESGTLYYIAYANDTPVGYMAIKPTADHLFLSKLYLLSEHRGQGIARMLLNLAMEQATAMQLSSLCLSVNRFNTQSIAAYQKMGFAIIDEVDVDIGQGYWMNDYRMQREIV